MAGLENGTPGKKAGLMKTVIVGGGWSGLAAAVRLCEQGHQVHLVESARQLGGRARNVDWQGLTIDNGQHLIIGAYQRTLALLETLGAKEKRLFERRPLALALHDTRYPTLQINAGRGLPWPLSFAWRLVRDNDLTTFKQISRLFLHSRKLQAVRDITVADWLVQLGQSDRLIRQLWEPLCLATLNTPIASASAHVFTSVIRETFRYRHHTDLLIPRVPLGDLVPHYAELYIRRRGAEISLQRRVNQISIKRGKVDGVIDQDDHFIDADQVIMATPPAVTHSLLHQHIALPAVTSFPIATVYLQYPPDVYLKQAMIGLSGTLSQWLFDRSEYHPGLIAVVISGPGDHEKLSKQALIETVADEVRQIQPDIPARPDDALVIREKRATFACNVDIQCQRPNNQTEITGLWLAGDYVANPYPATLEGAILNGEQTAMQLMEHLKSSR